MHNNQTDIFELTNKNITKNENNFFVSKEQIVQPSSFPESQKRINDYDFNLLKESAYKEIDDDLLKLEYKISKSEDEIKSLESQIRAAEEIRDFKLIENLSRRIESIKNNHETLLDIYNNKSFSAKISESFTDKLAKPVEKNIKNIHSGISKISEFIISMLPGKFSSFIEIKSAMRKLESINKSVDELMKLNIPYGENSERYRQLSSYIIKANSIHSEISGYVRKK